MAAGEAAVVSEMRLGHLAAAAVIVLSGACGDSTPVETGTPPTSTGPTSSAPAGPTTAPQAPTSPPSSTPASEPGRTVALGQEFLLDVGESVTVADARLTVSYAALVADSRCPIGVQCIQAGNATIAVVVTGDGGAPGALSLTTDGPVSGEYLNYTVELVELLRGTSPAARLKVT
jgi:hypothetical protein